jgi:hypothetical protein
MSFTPEDVQFAVQTCRDNPHFASRFDYSKLVLYLADELEKAHKETLLFGAACCGFDEDELERAANGVIARDLKAWRATRTFHPSPEGKL